MQSGNILIDHGIVDPDGDAVFVVQVNNNRHSAGEITKAVPQDGSSVTITSYQKPANSILSINNAGDYVFDPGDLAAARATDVVTPITFEIVVADKKDANHNPDLSGDLVLLRTFMVTGELAPNQAPTAVSLNVGTPYVAD